MKRKISQLIKEAYFRALNSGTLPQGPLPSFSVEYPPDETFGDYACNIALLLGAHLKRNPREVAEIIVQNLEKTDFIEKVEVAGPGFLNFFIKDSVWFESLREACIKGRQYGRFKKDGKRVLVEFVSANPTGPLHIGHGRIAAFGDSLSRLLEWSGWEVEREFYINDVGNQMELLGRSVLERCKELIGMEAHLPEDGYKGEYLIDVAHKILEKYGEQFWKLDEEEALKISSQEAKDIILNGIREELEAFRVHFDRFLSEASLYEQGKVEKALKELQNKGFIYENEGALWFKSTLFGDEKDRVVVRANGAKTYFASDIAYHRDKFHRGYDLLVNVWGADHHGYVKRLEAAIEALGYSKDKVRIILVQLVSLLRSGQRVSMSTRAGEFTALKEVIEEVGTDATRFFLLRQRAESPLEFDLEIAKAKNEENPVYYIQYAHARISSIFKKAQQKSWEIPDPSKVDLAPLLLPEERLLAKAVAQFPEVIWESSESFEPHPLTSYLLYLAKNFHSYYNKYRVLSEDKTLREARLILVWATKEVIRNGLEILGVSAPEEM